MRKSMFTEEQMVRILRETDKSTVAEVTKKHGVSAATLDQWKRKFGGMNVDDAKRLKSVENKTRRSRRCWPTACSKSTC